MLLSKNVYIIEIIQPSLMSILNLENNTVDD